MSERNFALAGLRQTDAIPVALFWLVSSGTVTERRAGAVLQHGGFMLLLPIDPRRPLLTHHLGVDDSALVHGSRSGAFSARRSRFPRGLAGAR